jgi:hypothetical protein
MIPSPSLQLDCLREQNAVQRTARFAQALSAICR